MTVAELISIAQEYQDEITRLRAAYVTAVEMAILACEHPVEHCLEAPGSPGFIVCRDCGYAEELWRCGPWRLQHAAYGRAPRAYEVEARKLIRAFLPQHQMEAEGRFGPERAAAEKIRNPWMKRSLVGLP